MSEKLTTGKVLIVEYNDGMMDGLYTEELTITTEGKTIYVYFDIDGVWIEQCNCKPRASIDRQIELLHEALEFVTEPEYKEMLKLAIEKWA